MGFTYIIATFSLFMGSTILGQTVSIGMQEPSPTVHHRAKRHSCEGEGGCPAGFEGFNGNCYYFSAQARPGYIRHWHEAQEECTKLGLLGERTIGLAELGENFEADLWLMKKIVEQDRPVWLGARSNGNNQWRWSTSNRTLSLDYPLWGQHQPNIWDNKKTCLSTLQYGGRIPHRQYLNDVGCDHIDLHYVCQLFCATGSHIHGHSHDEQHPPHHLSSPHTPAPSNVTHHTHSPYSPHTHSPPINIPYPAPSTVTHHTHSPPINIPSSLWRTVLKLPIASNHRQHTFLSHHVHK